jgi:hypothetical protein
MDANNYKVRQCGMTENLRMVSDNIFFFIRVHSCLFAVFLRYEYGLDSFFISEN